MTDQRKQRTTAGSARREAILRAAATMFASRGFHGVGVDDIGAAAGISGPAVYRHFPSKDAMLAEMLIGISERLLAGGTVRAAGATDPTTALKALVRWQVDFATDNRELITVHDRDLASLPDADRHQVRRLQRAYVEVWVDTLRQVRPGLGEQDARAAIHAVFGLINSTPHSAGCTDRAAMISLLYRMAIAALTASDLVSPTGITVTLEEQHQAHPGHRRTAKTNER